MQRVVHSKRGDNATVFLLSIRYYASAVYVKESIRRNTQGAGIMFCVLFLIIIYILFFSLLFIRLVCSKPV